MLDEFVPPNCL